MGRLDHRETKDKKELRYDTHIHTDAHAHTQRHTQVENNYFFGDHFQLKSCSQLISAEYQPQVTSKACHSFFPF